MTEPARPLRMLLVEDSPEDEMLVIRHLKRAGFAPSYRRVETEADFLQALSGELDVILSDYELLLSSNLVHEHTHLHGKLVHEHLHVHGLEHKHHDHKESGD